MTKWEDFFDYTTTTLLTTYRAYARPHAASLIEGVVRRHPEGGARRGVLRRRLVTVCLGRPGTPPARHYDLAARSSLHGSGKQLPAVVGRRAPKETEARPREPKTATVERREASVPRHGTQGASLGAWPAASCAGPTGASQAPERFSALHPPLDSGERSNDANPGRRNAPRERGGLFDIVKTQYSERLSDEPQFSPRARPHPEERAGWSGPAEPNGGTRVSKDEDGRLGSPHASRRIAARFGCGSSCIRIPLRYSSA